MLNMWVNNSFPSTNKNKIIVNREKEIAIETCIFNKTISQMKIQNEFI